MECWNLGILETGIPREGRRIAVQAVDPTALPKRERRRPLRQSHPAAAGRPSQSWYPVSPHHSKISIFQHSSLSLRLLPEGSILMYNVRT
jgi:hypothetical protein